MTSALEVLKSIRVWQIVVLLGVVGLAAAGTYAAFTMATAEEATDLEEDQRLVAVQRENFVNEISVNGTLVFTNRVTLSFGAAGTVSDVSFEEGQRVRAGDVLARLDGETISGLERKVVQAEGELRSAEEALAEARNPYTGVDLARAEADIADAMAAKALAEKALEDMSTPDPQAVARARVDIASAELSLRNAQEAPDRLMEPPSDLMGRQGEERHHHGRAHSAGGTAGALRAGRALRRHHLRRRGRYHHGEAGDGQSPEGPRRADRWARRGAACQGPIRPRGGPSHTERGAARSLSNEDRVERQPGCGAREGGPWPRTTTRQSL